MIRFHNGFIGMSNTCSRCIPTSPIFILHIHFSKEDEVQRIEQRVQDKIRSNEVSIDKMITDINSSQKKDQLKVQRKPTYEKARLEEFKRRSNS